MASSVEAVLETVDNTLDKIKAFTKAALEQDPRTVVQLWQEELSRRLVISQDPLPLVYCCNDVLQESRGESHDAYCEQFATILETELKAILNEKPQLRKQVEKVIKVWSDRRVFEKPFIRQLRSSIREEHEFDEQKDDGDVEDDGEQNDHGVEVAKNVDNESERNPSDIQKEALSTLPIARLLALSHWIEQEIRTSAKFREGTMTNILLSAEACVDESTSMETTLQVLVDLKEKTEILKKRRRCLQASAPVHIATRVGIEKAIQRVEDNMQHAGEDLSQCEQVSKVLDLLTPATSSHALEARYRTAYLIPRRERVVQQVAQGPDLSNSKERVLKEGLTAEAAVKSERPLVYHKGLQKWIPLPSGDDSDNWRD